MPKRPKFRVVTPSINPLNSPSLVNPNGTYLPPVNNPSTAAIGGTGGFGGMLPVSVGTGGTNVNTPAGSMLGVNNAFVQTPGTGSFLAAGGTQALGVVKQPLPVSPSASQPPAYGGYGIGGQQQAQLITGNNIKSNRGYDPGFRTVVGAATSAMADFERFEMDMLANNGTPNPQLLPAQLSITTIKSLNMDPQDLAELGYVQSGDSGMWVNQAKIPVQATTPLGAGDFYGYQYNEETGRSERVVMNEANASFENQLRWDPKKKKYRKIGQIQADYGYLPKTNPKPKTQKEINRERRQAEAPKANEENKRNVSYTSTTGNFNTATG